MTSYNIDQFSKITNIPKLNLRTWENRYSYLVPLRTKTNIRVYSDDLLVRGINTKLLLENGYKISKVSKMNDQEIQLEVKIDLIENLGFEKIIYAKLLENQIIIKSSENINEKTLTISFSKDKVLFFDKNKKRIR